MFGNLKTEGLEKATDSLGRGLLDTNRYEAEIKVVYVTKSQKGSMALNVVAEINGQEYRETAYVTNTQGENFYVKGGKKLPLPSFTTMNDLCLVGAGKSLAEMEPENKIVKIYNFEQKKEIPTEVPVIVELIGAKVGLLINKNLEDKTADTGGGVYKPTGETFEKNSIEKVFDLESGMTVVEATEGKETGEFVPKWVEKNAGKVRDRTDKSAKTGTPAAAAAGGAKKSLFGKK